ncbi:DNA polymerase III subunit psi [Vibrio sp. T187]|uniref:DNA polymerase III subunit psi n=1 Tax=Vibrio TaxID=662 RepID=UPI0010C9D5D2|nr:MULTISPECIES: DNA polymerase III subunit psi [Vibrio]MBW3694218.1 DNA polymerase III subunit psi [Vibrio sp. T187]
MPQTELQYLQEMGISYWELEHPERLAGYNVQPLSLPESCKLLLVSSEKPSGELAVMFERVLKSIKLNLDQALHITPSEFSAVDASSLEWVWFAGCSAPDSASGKVLQSPLLSDIDGNNQQRRALWQQICSYD